MTYHGNTPVEYNIYHITVIIEYSLIYKLYVRSVSDMCTRACCVNIINIIKNVISFNNDT